ncbi:hypothetical protein BLA29_014717 [Euroglyphus maynei]|uniref:Uncharacterized protein n=1 Tax=Euroglyphus maynei TaxID=6958 RepID=A0A1Y3B9X4_EURMA|nr:hypothetical protein BLA29_014717 [Euroglyphus maynei]
MNRVRVVEKLVVSI